MMGDARRGRPGNPVSRACGHDCRRKQDKPSREEKSRKVITKQANTGRHCPSDGRCSQKRGVASSRAGSEIRGQLLQLKRQVLRSEQGPQAEHTRGEKRGRRKGTRRVANRGSDGKKSPRSSRGQRWRGQGRIMGVAMRREKGMVGCEQGESIAGPDCAS